MTKLCPRGKAAAKRKFKVYPSAYANAYASKICAGKIKDPSGVKRKDFRGPKPSKAMGGRITKESGGPIKLGKRPNIKTMTLEQREKRFDKKGTRKLQDPRTFEKRREPVSRKKMMGGGMMQMPRAMYKKGGPSKKFPDLSGDGKVTMKDILMGRGVIKRPGKMGGGLMEATQRLRRQGLRGGGLCKKGMNREAIGKNS